MTVARLDREMSYRELIEWMLWDKVRSEPPRMPADDIFARFDAITGFEPGKERGN